MGDSRFRWEGEFQNTWDGQRKEEIGTALKIVRRTENVRRGVVRKLLLIIDMSEAIEEKDFLPSRRHHIRNSLISFFRSFSESNPLSTIGMLTAANEGAQMVTSIISERETILAALSGSPGAGKFSLTAALESASAFFQGSAFLNEIVLIVSSLSFFGKSPFPIVNYLLGKGVKIHTVHMAGEMHILRKMSEESGGVFGVVDSIEDIFTHLELICVPVPYTSTGRLSMLPIGFPDEVEEDSICACHLQMTRHGYECPFCTTKVCEVPGVCPICEGMLSSAVHLLKPLHWTNSAPASICNGPGECAGCQTQTHAAYICSKCESKVCAECNAFIRQELNFCIFCKEEISVG